MTQQMDITTPYREETDNIEVEVAPVYLSEESAPAKGQFFYMYAVRITNNRPEPVQLLTRKWTIRNGQGEVKEIEGDGVIGEQPWIKPGDTYTYRSFCPLTTPTGNMRGSYLFENEAGEEIEAKVPLFFFRMVDAPGNPQGLYSELQAL